MQTPHVMLFLWEAGIAWEMALHGKIIDMKFGKDFIKIILLMCDFLTVGSRVANNASSTKTPAPVKRLSKLDLPAFV